MRHCRTDYEAIQPWPIKRPHYAKVNGESVLHVPGTVGEHDRFEPVIPEDEPVFVIRAKDATAPDVVHYWADRAEQEGADPQLVARVHVWAEEMRDYASQNYTGGKTPDTAPEFLTPVP